MRRDTARKTAVYGMMVALAMVMSYVEAVIPVPIPVPGVKLGLANLVTITALYMTGPLPAAAISLLRIVLVGLTFGNMYSMIYGLAGGCLSLISMIAARRSGLFGRTGVSVIGGMTHNIGQLLVAAFVVQSPVVFAYLPALLLSGIIAGTLIGLLGGLVIRRLPDADRMR